MAKLTNRQMEILAERVVDILEDQHKAFTEEVKKTDDYINFEREYFDDNLITLGEFKKKYTQFCDLKNELEKYADKFNGTDDVYINHYSLRNANYDYADLVIENYIEKQKEKKFRVEPFNRDKMLRKIQADILLSDVGNPEELVNSMVSKFNK